MKHSHITRRLVAVVGAILLFATGIVNSASAPPKSTEFEKQKFEEYSEVIEALEPYIQSAKTGDGQLNSSAFYDHAHIVGSIGGEFYNMDVLAFAGAVSAGGESPEIQHHIAWIDVSGPAAAAKVEFIHWGGLRFTDFFVLYKHEGQWKISGKVYDSHSNN
jgi:hypothetical protein